LNPHEQNDPRKGAREHAERRLRNRTTRRLLVVVFVLVALILFQVARLLRS
jgi:hypothetical protein